MRKIVILKNGGGELANQLWNYVSVCAYGMELSATVKNPSFFEYHNFFRFLPRESVVTKFFSFFFRWPRRRAHIINRAGRLKYTVISKLASHIFGMCEISSENNKSRPVYLPPTAPVPEQYGNCDTLYMSGWLFRNPKGLKKYRNELLDAFRPVEKIEKIIGSITGPLRQKYEKIIGIHIRQADYKIFKDGKYLIEQDRIRQIVGEYAGHNMLEASKTVFIITSDGPIDTSFWKSLNVYISKENAVVDLFLLSKTDVILGSDSSFGAFASWYGNIPHIIFKKESIDWEYYADKTSYFENKYSTMARY